LYLQFRFDDDCWLNAIDAVSEKSVSVVEVNVDKKVTALMNVNDCEVRFQLDSAADVNTICKKFVRKDQVRPTSITLRMNRHSKITDFLDNNVCDKTVVIYGN
jgi:glutaredoxin-related protein